MQETLARASQTTGPQGWARAFQDLSREHGFEPLEIEGRLPDDLAGTLYRNGPSLFSSFGRRYAHWFDGDGAVSAVRFGPDGAEGAVRLVQSRGLQEERAASRPLYGAYGTRRPGNALQRAFPRFKNAANTSVLLWQDRLFALFEPAKPTELAVDDLATLGEADFGGAIPRAFSAHPHRVPARHATYNFGVRYGRTPLLDLFELPDTGQVRRIGTVPLGGSTMIHDFMATQRHLIFFAPPLRANLPRLLLGLDSFSDSLRWEPSLGTEVIVVPIEEPDQVTRFHVDPFYQWHFANGFDRDGGVVVDLVRYPDFRSNRLLGDVPTGRPTGQLDGTLHRALIDTGHQTLRMEQVWDATCEFPRVNPEAAGQPYGYAYVAAHDGANLPRQLAKVDPETGRATLVELGDDQYVSEPVFVPRRGAAAEDDGYLLTLVYDAIQHRSHVAVLDAREPERGAIARAWFNHHIPSTFHGAWAPDRESEAARP